MVPAVFGFVEAIPITPSGKVDRRALPPPEDVAAEARPYVPPRDELEAALARFWAEALRVDRVGVETSFVELGGDSIQGALLINRLQSVVGGPVPVAAILEAPTVARFAGYLRERFPEVASRLGILPSDPATPPSGETDGRSEREVFEL